MFRGILSFAVILGFAALAPSEDKKEAKPKADPEGTPLEISIVSKTTKYTLDTGGLSTEEYAKKIADSAKPNGGKLPAAPAVDLTIVIKNTSDKAVTVWTKGDPVVLDMLLTGKGAVSAAPLRAFTREFRLPQGVEIAAGKTVEIPVKSLSGGFRGASTFAFWTAPGDYEITAKFKTGMSPVPKGAKDDGDGFGGVTLTSAPFKVTVEEKK